MKNKIRISSFTSYHNLKQFVSSNLYNLNGEYFKYYSNLLLKTCK